MNNEERKITVSIIGSGGGGGKMVLAAAAHLNRNENNTKFYSFRWYLYDLSNDVETTTKRILENFAGETKPIAIKPTEVDPGAGGVPLCAEIAFDFNPYYSSSPGSIDVGYKKTKSFGVIFRSSINIYVSTLGGGTGGRTISLLIPRLRQEVGGIADIAICALTDREDENLNHIYTFPLINKSADFLIFVENGIIIEDKRATENFINKRTAEIVDFLISSRHPDTRPRPFDSLNYINHISKDPNYDTKRWLIPFIYPVEGYDKNDYKTEPLLHFVDKAFETVSTKEEHKELVLYKRCLCQVENEKIKRCSSCIVIIKAPEEYINDFEERIRDIDGKILTEQELFLRGLENKLDIRREDIFYVFTPDEEGFKICLLLQNIPILKLKKLRKYLEKGDIKEKKKAWMWGMKRGIKNMVDGNLIKDKKVEEVEENYIKKIDTLTEEFEKSINIYDPI